MKMKALQPIDVNIIPESPFNDYIKSEEFQNLIQLEKAQYVRDNSISKEYIYMSVENKTGKIIWADMAYYSYSENMWCIVNKGYIHSIKSKDYSHYYLVEQ